MRIFALLFLMFALGACIQGGANYQAPETSTRFANSKTVDQTKSQVWSNLIPKIGKEFFVINNLDKESGLVNISYSGDPSRFVDCGTVQHTVTNLQGTRNYSFPGASPSETYETTQNGMLFRVSRQMALDGRMNLIIEELSPGQTQVSANTRYVLTKDFRVWDVQNRMHSDSETINFNGGSVGTFSSGTQCKSTGEFERIVLDLVNS